MQLLITSFKSVLSEKKKSLSVLFVVAVATIFALLSISISMSFALKTVGELQEFMPVLVIYTQSTGTALSRWVGVINIFAIIVSSLLVLGCFLFETLGRKKQFKNYSLMGASFSQVALLESIKNAILVLAGVIVGALVALLGALVIGAIFSVTIVFAFENVLICAILYLALSTILSIVVPLWC